MATYTLNDQQKCCCFSSHEEGGADLNAQKPHRVWLFYKHIFILLVSRPQKQKGAWPGVCGSLEPVKAVRLFGPAALHVNNSVIIDFISIPALSASLHLFPRALLMHLTAQQALHILWGCKKKTTGFTAADKIIEDIMQCLYYFASLCKNITQLQS